MSRVEFSAAGATDGLWAGASPAWSDCGEKGSPQPRVLYSRAARSSLQGAQPTELSRHHVPVATTSSGDACVNGWKVYPVIWKT